MYRNHFERIKSTMATLRMQFCSSSFTDTNRHPTKKLLSQCNWIPGGRNSSLVGKLDDWVLTATYHASNLFPDSHVEIKELWLKAYARAVNSKFLPCYLFMALITFLRSCLLSRYIVQFPFYTLPLKSFHDFHNLF